MASYFDELHLDENIIFNNRNDLITNAMPDPLDSWITIPVLRPDIRPASVSEVSKLRPPVPDMLLGDHCQICLSNYELKDKALEMPCEHIFHESCLKTWLSKSNFCPLCKFELKTNNPVYEYFKEVELRNRRRAIDMAQLHNSMFS